ncbi:MAG: hypothetical protein RR806_07875 [Oscillospiraceae bacterium]
MEKLYCPYCGELLENNCGCEREIAEQQEELVAEIEERQHQSGFYAFQDVMENWRNER